MHNTLRTMYVSLFVCMYACMYSCMHACMYVNLCACMYSCMHACMHVNPYACMHNTRHHLSLNPAPNARELFRPLGLDVPHIRPEAYRLILVVHCVLLQCLARRKDHLHTEVCASVKRDLFIGKRGLFIWQKRPSNTSIPLERVVLIPWYR